MFSLITFAPKDCTGTEYSFFLQGGKILCLGNTQSGGCYHLYNFNRIRDKFNPDISSKKTLSRRLITKQLKYCFDNNLFALWPGLNATYYTIGKINHLKQYAHLTAYNNAA